MRRSAALALLALALLAEPSPADEARWSRQVDVARPGTVVVELDGRATERAEIDLELIGPDGRAVQFELYRASPAAGKVRVTRVTPSDAGWQVELDAGAAPPRHDRLRFALAAGTAAAEVVLEGGGDRAGGGWRELARGSLFRLGDSDNLQNFELAYPPTEVRLLRLTWPRDAGLPELQNTEILTAIGAGELRAVPIACGDAGKTLDCRFAAPADCGSLEVELAPQDAPLGYRHFCYCRNQAGEQWTEGEQRRHGLLHLDRVPGGVAHRLRLHSEIPPKVLGASCRQDKTRLVFEAEAAGAYRLLYGRLSPRDRRVGGTARPPEPEVPAVLGPEVEGPAPAWPPAAGPGAPLGGKFERSWPIEKSSARGQLVVLPLPGELSRVAGPGPGGLRIDAGGAQLPFIYAAAVQPEKVLVATLRPTPTSGAPGKSRIEIRTAGTGHRVELMLFATGPFERSLRFVRRQERPLRPERNSEAAAPEHWSCPASLARGCLLRTEIYLAKHEESPDFFVEFADGDNPPLAEVEAELWAERKVLYFVDPGGPLVLRWDRALGDPAYDFASLEPVLRRDEAVVARLGAELAGAGAAEAPRWLLLVAIAVAAIVLLAVLARVLRQGPA